MVGVRLLTEVLSPAVFGEASLLAGVAMLITTTLVNPSMQALLRHYPAEESSGDRVVVKMVAVRNIWLTVKTASPVFLPLIGVAVLIGWVTPISAMLVAALVGVDGLRSLQISLLNATRRHSWFGIWQNGEAWGRPIIAYGAVTMLGASADVVLAAFVLTTGLLYLGLRRLTIVSHEKEASSKMKDERLLDAFKSFTRPLMPVGLIGWTSNMADRYMIGWLLSTKDVGAYVAVYSLASRPLLMLASIAENTIRPRYYSALRAQSPVSMKYVGVWFLIAIAGSTGVCIGFIYFHGLVSSFLLGPEFRESSYLAPWIAAGYGIYALTNVTTRICFAYDATKSVLLSEATGAVLSVMIGFPLIYFYGVEGAAMAVPLYFALQFLMSAHLARQAVRQGADNQPL